MKSKEKKIGVKLPASVHKQVNMESAATGDHIYELLTEAWELYKAAKAKRIIEVEDVDAFKVALGRLMQQKDPPCLGLSYSKITGRMRIEVEPANFDEPENEVALPPGAETLVEVFTSKTEARAIGILLDIMRGESDLAKDSAKFILGRIEEYEYYNKPKEKELPMPQRKPKPVAS